MKLTVWLNKVVISVALAGCFVIPALAQETPTLSLDDVRRKAAANFPLAKQKEIIRQTGEININNFDYSVKIMTFENIKNNLNN